MYVQELEMDDEDLGEDMENLEPAVDHEDNQEESEDEEVEDEMETMSVADSTFNNMEDYDKKHVNFRLIILLFQ